ncbi:MAG: hypothetical protein GY869_28905, partial [Planctomycetes bacterium]|nr:hypothetical protein [Planctomycetota bacterium]
GALGIAVNWIENKAYTAYPLKIYDRDTGIIVPIDVEADNDATRVFYNSSSNRIYTDSEVNAISTIIEGVSDDFINQPISSSTLKLAFRNSTNHVYYVGKKFIGILDDPTRILELIPVDNPSPGSIIRQGIDINQTTGRVYVINDANALDFVTVVQDSDILTRPPVHLVSIGFPARLHLLDPVSRDVMQTHLPTTSSFQGDHATAILPGSGLLYVPHVSSFVEEMQVYTGIGTDFLRTTFSSGGDDSRAIAFLPDGSQFYVTNSGSDNVSVLEASTNSVITSVSVGEMPWGIAATPDAAKVLTANQDDNTVSVINTASNTETNTITVGTSPWGLAINPGGTKAYVANSGSGTVSVIDIASEAVIATVNVGTNPHWLAFTPDGRQVYVSNRSSGSVSIIDTGTDTVIQTVTGLTNPEGIGVLPDGSEAFVANSISAGNSTVSVINTSDYSVTTITLPAAAKATTSLAIADPTSGFAGRVTGNGLPVDGATVRALQGGEEKGTAITNAAGDYSIFNLKAGTYDIEVSAPGYISQNMNGQIAEAGRTTVLNFSLIPIEIAIDDVAITEGNTGTVEAVFTVSLSVAGDLPVTVDYATEDGTALTGVDYTAASGSLTFTTRDTVQTISVDVIGDAIDEPDEIFFVNLSNAGNTVITDDQGQGTIIDDDEPPFISISDTTITEGNTRATIDANFTVSLSVVSGKTITVDFQTSDGTATAG